MASGIAYSAENPKGAHFELRWKTENAGIGSTKVKWELWRCGRYETPTRYSHGYTLIIKDQKDGKLLEKNKAYPEAYVDNDINTFDDNKIAAKADYGEFTVGHELDGSAKIKVSFPKVYIGSTDNLEKDPDTETLFDLPNNKPYTACQPPTNVSVYVYGTTNKRRTIVPTQEKINISWTAGSGGSNNPIVKYYIYARVSTAGDNPQMTSSYKVGEVASTVTSTTISQTGILSGLSGKRGQKIRFGVVAVGQVSNYHSSMAYAQNTIIINNRPTKPTVSLRDSANLVKSTVDRVAFVANAGTDSQSYHTPQVYYRINTTDKYQSYTSGTSLALGEAGTSTTFYFASYDSLEYSDPVTITVTRNSKPAISINVTGTNLESVNKGLKDVYILSPTVTLTPNRGQSSNNKYTYSVRWAKTNSDAVSSSADVKAISSNNSNSTLSISDIRLYIPPNSQDNIYYRFECQRSDGLENSEKICSAVYCITKVPSFKRITNSLGNYNTDGDLSNYFSNILKFYYSYDEGYRKIILNVEADNKPVQSNQIVWMRKLDDDNMGGQFGSDGQTSSLAEGSTYEFKIASIGTNSYSYNYASNAVPPKSFTKIYSPPTVSEFNLTWGESGSVINPFYSVEAGKKLIFLNFLQVQTPNAEAAEKCGFLDVPSFKIQAKYRNKTHILSASHDVQSEDISNLQITLSEQEIYELLWDDNNPLNLNKLNKSGYDITITISATNAFGDQYVGQTIKRVNFTSGSEGLTSIWGEEAGNGNSPAISSNTGNFYMENTTLTLNCNCFTYYNMPQEIEVSFLDSSSTKRLLFSSTDSWNIVRSSVSWIDGINQAKKQHYSLSRAFDISEIETEYTIEKIKVRVKDGLGDWSAEREYSLSDASKISLLKHVISEITIKDGVVNDISEEVDGIQVGYSIISGLTSNDNVTKKEEKDFQYRLSTNDNWHSFKEQEEGVSIISGELETGWSFVNVRVKVETTLSYNDVSSQKTSYSNELIIYNATPTVSYRKNQVGINYDPTGDSNNDDISNIQEAALVVGAHSGKNKVVFKSANQELVINLDDGQISSFIIDCGTWDPS